MIVIGTDGMIRQGNILRCILGKIVSHEFEVIAFSLLLWTDSFPCRRSSLRGRAAPRATSFSQGILVSYLGNPFRQMKIHDLHLPQSSR
jgi:hypothetical protein